MTEWLVALAGALAIMLGLSIGETSRGRDLGLVLVPIGVALIAISTLIRAHL